MVTSIDSEGSLSVPHDFPHCFQSWLLLSRIEREILGIQAWEEIWWLGVQRTVRPPWHFTAYCHQSSEDLFRWGNNLDGLYLVKANYQLMSSNKALIDQWPWKLVWQEKMPPKLQDFCWLALRNAFWVLTKANHKRRRCHLANRCNMCITIKNLSIIYSYISITPCCFRHLVYHLRTYPSLAYSGFMPFSIREIFHFC